MSFKKHFDIIVIGAGHAGIEASLASARLGLQVVNITTNLQRIGFMSCNPSIGGLGKGHMVREMDVLGGQMGRAADFSCIQFKRLNARKGPAVRGSRSQCDKDEYSQYMYQTMMNHPNITLLEAEVKSLKLQQQKVEGVVLEDGSAIESLCVIVTTGTFMRGVMHVGSETQAGGRVGDKASIGLSDQLKNLGFDVRRLKTGTPPRLAAESIDWSLTKPEYGDEIFSAFSYFSPKAPRLRQIACYLSHTNEQTHEVIRNNLDKSPMYCGAIEGTGPRYCPSIEDKVVRFSDRISHQTFLEPEGLNTNSIYLQGISTSLPESVQDEFLRTIPGLKNVRVLKYGYAVEYDYFEPTQIWHSLETRQIDGLFLAGQINGTSGYEEAAAQGFIAGVNAVRKIKQVEPLVLERDQAYIGVLIDDLVTKGTKEPYRMFTSRAEHRLVLREDNNIDRLLPISQSIGVLSAADIDILSGLSVRQQKLKVELQSKRLFPDEKTRQVLLAMQTPVIQKPMTFAEMLRRVEINCSMLKKFDLDIDDDTRVTEPVEIELKYEGYIKQQLEFIAQCKKFEELLIPREFDYGRVTGLSNEEREKLSAVLPRTVGQARRISGVNPSGIQALVVHLKGKRQKRYNTNGIEDSRVVSQN